MRKALSILLAGSFAVQTLRPATDVYALIPDGYANVSPGAAISFNLNVAGCDTISVTANGVSLGRLYYPYTVSFTSVSSGPNTVIVTYCDFRGRSISSTNTLNSGSRTFKRRLKR